MNGTTGTIGTIGIISPSFPPRHCGVGDHASRLALELATRGSAVKVWTTEPGALSPEPGKIDVRVVSASAKSLLALPATIARSGVDALLVEYTPTLYGRWGLRPGLAPWLAAVRASLGRKPVVLLAHELHYPLGLTPDRLALGSLQLAQLLALATVCSGVICSYDAAAESLRRWLPWRRDSISAVPVGANIEPMPGGDAQAIPSGKLVLLHFGFSHPTRMLEDCLEAVDGLNADGVPAVLALAGLSNEDLALALSRRRASARADAKSDAVLALGYLQPPDVSAWMRRADLVVMPFMDGISTRRSSAMAAFAHGKAVATTRGWASKGEVPWDRFAALAPAGDTEAFIALVKRMAGDEPGRRRLGEAARLEFERRFSWPTIADSVIRKLAR